jgi:NTE family protein
VAHDQGRSHLTIGDPNDTTLLAPVRESFATRSYFVKFSYDRLDDVNFPRYGQQASLQWRGTRNVTSTQEVSDQITFNYLGAHSFGRHTLVFSTSVGTTLENRITDIRLLFPLGGFLNLSGLRADSLVGPQFGIARFMYYRQIGRGGPGVLDVPTYLGMSLEAGNVWQSTSEASLSNTRKDASIFLGMDTFLGPVYLATGFDDHGEQEFYLFLGRNF